MNKTSENERDYIRRRREQELDAAKSAKTSSAREAHEQLAEFFNEDDEDRPSYMEGGDGN